jgi:hypothetical protein
VITAVAWNAASRTSGILRNCCSAVLVKHLVADHPRATVGFLPAVTVSSRKKIGFTIALPLRRSSTRVRSI